MLIGWNKTIRIAVRNQRSDENFVLWNEQLKSVNQPKNEYLNK